MSAHMWKCLLLDIYNSQSTKISAEEIWECDLAWIVALFS